MVFRQLRFQIVRAQPAVIVAGEFNAVIAHIGNYLQAFRHRMFLTILTKGIKL